MSIISTVNYLLVILMAKKYFNITIPPQKEGRQAFTESYTSENEWLNDCHPVIGSLIHEKMEKALSRGIALTLKIDSNIKIITLHPLTTASLLGNLIDNVIAATSALKPEKKQVTITLCEKAKSYIFTVAVPRTSSLNMENSFSTQNPKQKYNLLLIKSMVTEYGGKIEISSNPASFKVTLPKGEKCA